MPIRDFDTALAIVGRNIRDALLGSASSAATPTKATHTLRPQLSLPTAISPCLRLILRGKGPRNKLGSHSKSRGTAKNVSQLNAVKFLPTDEAGAR
jgi:hypothetical protein